jgi:hypothetical protein
MSEPQLSLDGLVEYYLDRKTSPGDIRRALKIHSKQYAAILRRNNLRRKVDPQAHREILKAVEDYFNAPSKDARNLSE